ncbi:DUF3331 domain-containing protein [Paraburkholderia hospita]|uniref:DUF3331 domain-containing protein n=1 Tax=Paraburkholderia hospita TaxID=169430 RepID=UPI001FC896DE|nr:DUF3331 domain-containing protein [Paraburkholderia hospita]
MILSTMPSARSIDDDMQVLPAVETSFSKKMRRAIVRVGQRVTRLNGFLCRPVSLVREILSARTVSVSWSDPQTWHYAERIWRLGLAGSDGFCALSGLPVGGGDDVFRPRRSATGIPANWSRMILAAAVPIDRQVAALKASQCVVTAGAVTPDW